MEVGSSSSITLGAFLPLSPASQAETGEVPKLPGQQTTQDDSGPYRLDSNTVEQQLPLLASSLLSSAAATSPQKQPASRVAAAQQVAAPHLAGAPSDPTPAPAAPAAPAGASTGEVSGEGAGGASAATETDETGDSATEELTEEEQQQVQELKSRDREVRQHEQAHMAAAGGHARGGPSYEYTTGPDNRRYATGGEVSIDTSKANDPAATISKAQAIYRAALAPAEPSSQDRSVASAAKQMEAEARREMAESRRSEASEGEQQAEGSAENSAAASATAPEAGAGTTGPSQPPTPNSGSSVGGQISSFDGAAATGAERAADVGQLLNLVA